MSVAGNGACVQGANVHLAESYIARVVGVDGLPNSAESWLSQRLYGEHQLISYHAVEFAIADSPTAIRINELEQLHPRALLANIQARHCCTHLLCQRTYLTVWRCLAVCKPMGDISSHSRVHPRLVGNARLLAFCDESLPRSNVFSFFSTLFHKTPKLASGDVSRSVLIERAPECTKLCVR